MKITIDDISPGCLAEYARIPIAFRVKSILTVELVDGGLGGTLFHEVPVIPYIKDYDAHGELPTDWPKRFDVTNWSFFLAKLGDRPVGAATVAFDTTGVFMLEARRNLAVLWDIRVLPEARGAQASHFSNTQLNGLERMAVRR